MCIATVTAIAAVTAAVTGATAAVAGGIAQQRSANYQAQVARNNAVIAQQNAAHAASAGAAQTEAASMKAAQRQGLLRAALGANGLDVNSGSAADVQTGQRELGNLDAATTANNAALEVYGYQTQSGNQTAQSGLYGLEAAFAPAEGALKGAGILLSNSSVDSALAHGANDIFGSSQLSGDPTVPDEFSWMQSPGGGIDTGA
jgi:hypothetical protein